MNYIIIYDNRSRAKIHLKVVSAAPEMWFCDPAWTSSTIIIIALHKKYFISGFGAGNKMIDLLCSHIGIVQIAINYLLFYRNIQSFNMILILYVIPCKLSCDFIKLTILYIHVHLFYHYYDK